LKIKICGLRRAEDIEACNAARPDYVGFVFAKQSRRYVAPQDALLLRKRLAAGILPVGVFVDAEIDFIERLYDNGVIKLAQLHGDESEAYIARLQAVCPVPVIKALRPALFTEYALQPSAADYLLLDSGAGSGQPFDWSDIPAFRQPWFLAGGVSQGNLADAIAQNPYAIDVSSGAETNGWKDLIKIAELVRTVRRRR
jgi:phosphoribosylanthranilate isomerase